MVAGGTSGPGLRDGELWPEDVARQLTKMGRKTKPRTVLAWRSEYGLAARECVRRGATAYAFKMEDVTAFLTSKPWGWSNRTVAGVAPEDREPSIVESAFDTLIKRYEGKADYVSRIALVRAALDEVLKLQVKEPSAIGTIGRVVADYNRLLISLEREQREQLVADGEYMERVVVRRLLSDLARQAGLDLDRLAPELVDVVRVAAADVVAGDAMETMLRRVDAGVRQITQRTRERTASTLVAARATIDAAGTRAAEKAGAA
jgi:hypothetical protein